MLFARPRPRPTSPTNQGYKAPTITTAGKAKTLGSFNFGPAASTPEEIAAANAVRAEAEKRLTAGDSLLPAAVDPGRFAFNEKNLKGGLGEKLAGILGTGLSAYGSLANDAAGQRTTIEALRKLGIYVDGDKENQ